MVLEKYKEKIDVLEIWTELYAQEVPEANVKEIKKGKITLREQEAVMKQLKKEDSDDLETLAIYLHIPKPIEQIYQQWMMGSVITLFVGLIAFIGGTLSVETVNDLKFLIEFSRFIFWGSVLVLFFIYVYLHAIKEGRFKCWKKKQVETVFPVMIEKVLEEKYRTER